MSCLTKIYQDVIPLVTEFLPFCLVDVLVEYVGFFEIVPVKSKDEWNEILGIGVVYSFGGDETSRTFDEILCEGLYGLEHIVSRPITYENLHLIWEKTDHLVQRTATYTNYSESQYAIVEIVWDEQTQSTWLLFVNYCTSIIAGEFDTYGEFFPSFETLMKSATSGKRLSRELCDEFIGYQRQAASKGRATLETI